MTYLLLLPFALYIAMATAGFLYAMYIVPPLSKSAFGRSSYGVKSVLKWFCMFFIGLAVEIVGYVIAPFAVAFADRQMGRMPNGFRWLETPDALLPGYPAEQGFDRPVPDAPWAWYRQSVSWLWRNRCYRFASEQMGVQIAPGERVAVFGDMTISDDNPAHLGGYVRISKNCFECERIFRFAGKPFALRVGYKMRQVTSMNGYAQHVCRILPINH